MIDNTGWEYVYKLSQGERCATNVLYTPSVSPEGDRMCMHFWLHAEPYMPGSCVPRTEELLEYWFKRELKYMTLFQGRPWCPEIYDVDEKERKILIEFNKETLNWPMYQEGRCIEDVSPTWKEDLFSVIEDVLNLGYYKASLYPHCFFYTNDGQIKMLDYYATLEQDGCVLHKDIVEPIIGEDSEHRFIEVKQGDYFDLGLHFKNSLKNWIKWPGDPLPEFHDKLFG